MLVATEFSVACLRCYAIRSDRSKTQKARNRKITLLKLRYKIGFVKRKSETKWQLTKKIVKQSNGWSITARSDTAAPRLKLRLIK